MATRGWGRKCFMAHATTTHARRSKWSRGPVWFVLKRHGLNHKGFFGQRRMLTYLPHRHVVGVRDLAIRANMFAHPVVQSSAERLHIEFFNVKRMHRRRVEFHPRQMRKHGIQRSVNATVERVGQIGPFAGNLHHAARWTFAVHQKMRLHFGAVLVLECIGLRPPEAPLLGRGIGPPCEKKKEGNMSDENPAAE